MQSHALLTPAYASQQWVYNEEAGTFVLRGGGGTALCLRHFAEAQSLAAWACSGVAEERFMPSANTVAGAFCTGQGAARACVRLADSQ